MSDDQQWTPERLMEVNLALQEKLGTAEATIEMVSKWANKVRPEKSGGFAEAQYELLKLLGTI